MVHMSDRSGMARVGLPIWLLASFATAAFAHACIGLLGDAGIGGDAYAAHAHGAVVPVALAATSLSTVVLLRYALHALRNSTTGESIAALVRRCAEVNSFLAVVAVALGGVATLLAMEFTEQCYEFGSVRGLTEALGGNVPLGLAIVAIVAALVTIVGLRSARILATSAVAAVGALFFLFVLKRDVLECAAIVRRVRQQRSVFASAFIARCFGMRAPPLPALV
jgi:hypothetical protein